MKLSVCKIEGGSKMRTDKMVGSGSWPTVGRPLVVVGRPIDPGAQMRMLTTSTIQEILVEEGGAAKCTTETGSVYLVSRED